MITKEEQIKKQQEGRLKIRLQEYKELCDSLKQGFAWDEPDVLV